MAVVVAGAGAPPRGRHGMWLTGTSGRWCSATDANETEARWMGGQRMNRTWISHTWISHARWHTHLVTRQRPPASAATQGSPHPPDQCPLRINTTPDLPGHQSTNQLSIIFDDEGARLP